MNEEIPYNPPGMDDYIRKGARKNSALLSKAQGKPASAQSEAAKADSLKRVVRALPGVPERVETGAVQFGDDWPGVFIRGDNAGYFALCLKQMLEGDDNAMTRMILTSLQETLAGCIQGSAGQLLEMRPNVDISDRAGNGGRS